MIKKGLYQAGDCLETGDGVELEGKVIVVDPPALPADNRDGQHQIFFCTGGNGRHPNSSEGPIIAVSLADRRLAFWDRRDILGTAKPEILTDLNRLQLSKIRPVGALDLDKHEHQYSAYCFLPDGRYPRAALLCSPSEVKAYIDMQKDYQHRIMVCDRDDFCVFEMVEGEVLFPAGGMMEAHDTGHEEGDMELSI